MSDRERLRREDPVRTGPIRSWSTLYRRPDSWDYPNAAAEPNPAADEAPRASWTDTVTYGVELGYRVIEEQIRQGQRVAEQLNDRTYGPRAMSNDVREAAQRLLYFYADTGALWFDFFASLAGGNVDLVRRFLGGPLAPTPAAASRTAHAPAGVSIDILAVRPTQVRLDLHSDGDALTRPLAAQPLSAHEVGVPPLTDVTFARGARGLELRVRVPDTQRPGVYTGTVIDRDTGEIRGTLTVRVTA